MTRAAHAHWLRRLADRATVWRTTAFSRPGWVVAAAAALVYLNSIRNGFALDDVWIVIENPYVTNTSRLLRLWAQPYWPGDAGQALGLYRPLTIALYNLQWAAGGGAAWVFHLANVLLHAAVAVLVLRLAMRLVLVPFAAAGALVFAVHPVHTEAVANVVGQAELLAAAFVLLACLAALRATAPAQPWGRVALVALCYAAAIALKEHALVLPALLAFLLPAARRVDASSAGEAGASWRRVAQEWLGEWRLFAVLALVAAGFLLVRWQVLGSALSVEAPWVPFEQDPATRVRTALRLWNEYARLLLWPFDLSADYSIAVILPAERIGLQVVTGAALLAGTIGLALSLPRWPLAGLCAAWFLIAILPVSNLILVAGVVLAERTLYLPSVALALAVAAALHFMRGRLRLHPRRSVLRRLSIVGGAVVLVAFGVRTWLRNPDWASTAAVNAALLRDHPESYKSQWYAAGLAFERGDTAEADERFVLALRLQPGNPQLGYDYGEFLMRTGHVDSAITVLNRATQQRFYRGTVNDLLALAYLRAGRCAAALERVRSADAESRDWQSRLVEVEALVALDRLAEAADAALPMAAAEGPARSYRWQMAAQVLADAGHTEEADAARAAGRRIARDDAAAEAATLAAAQALQRDRETPCRSP